MKEFNRRQFLGGLVGVTSELWLPGQQFPTSNEPGPWFGRATYYSRAGCIGCSPGLKMANGRPLVDGDYTIAFMFADLGTHVWVMNMSELYYPTVLAEVADRGGFRSPRYIRDNIIADLTLRIHGEINNQSKESLIKIVRALPEEVELMAELGSHSATEDIIERVATVMPYENLMVKAKARSKDNWK